MTKQEALSIIKLLSALESWAWSTGKCLPDHTSMALEAAMGLLERDVLRPLETENHAPLETLRSPTTEGAGEVGAPRTSWAG